MLSVYDMTMFLKSYKFLSKLIIYAISGYLLNETALKTR